VDKTNNFEVFITKVIKDENKIEATAINQDGNASYMTLTITSLEKTNIEVRKGNIFGGKSYFKEDDKIKGELFPIKESTAIITKETALPCGVLFEEEIDELLSMQKEFNFKHNDVVSDILPIKEIEYKISRKDMVIDKNKDGDITITIKNIDSLFPEEIKEKECEVSFTNKEYYDYLSKVMRKNLIININERKQ